MFRTSLQEFAPAMVRLNIGVARLLTEGEQTSMDNPAAQSLLDTVRQINQIAQRARSGEPGVEDYLRAVSADPVTEWFTGLLREKNEELQQERERADRLAKVLRGMGITEP